MKKIFVVLFALGSLSAGTAQQAPDHTPAGGYWVVEDNIKVKKEAILRCYNDEDQLIAEKHLTGRKLNFKKATAHRKFRLLLEKAMIAYNDHRDSVPKILVDNGRIKITEYISQPGQDVCGKGKHTHQDHATILLTDAKVKTTKEDGATEIETYSAGEQLYIVDRNGKTEKMSTDGAFWVKGTTHSVTNVGDKPIRFFIIEARP